MLVLFVLAVVSLVLGLLFLGGQETLKKLDAMMNKTVLKLGGSGLNKNKEKLVGLLLIIFAAVLFFVGYSLKR